MEQESTGSQSPTCICRLPNQHPTDSSATGECRWPCGDLDQCRVRRSSLWSGGSTPPMDAALRTTDGTMQASVTAHHPVAGAAGGRASTSLFAACATTPTIWLVFATAAGLLLAFKFGTPGFRVAKDPSFGWFRPIRINATFHGLASIGMAGVAYCIAARRCSSRFHSTRLAWVGLAPLNMAQLAGGATGFDGCDPVMAPGRRCHDAACMVV